MNYLLDTNILVLYLRQSKLADFIDRRFNPLGSENVAILSAVSLGELESLGLQNNWGQKRLLKLEEWMDKLIVTNINTQDVISMYGQIDAFSQGKLKNKPLFNSARNMGKNDLWIAATAAVTQATLLTTDKDFQHLKGIFFEVELLEAM